MSSLWFVLNFDFFVCVSIGLNVMLILSPFYKFISSVVPVGHDKLKQFNVALISDQSCVREQL